jgi:hypothetical protein
MLKLKYIINTIEIQFVMKLSIPFFYTGVTVQVLHRFILKKYISEIDSEGLVEAVFEANIRSNHCLR